MTRILVLSATTGYQLRSFGDAAARLGIELIFATDRCHRLDDPWQDRAVAVRFHETGASVRAIVEAARRWPMDGLIAVGDRPTVLAAEAARALGLPGNPPDGAAASANKEFTRARLAAAGCFTPWFRAIAPGTTLDAVANDPRCALPWVLKPIGLSGSRGVIRADSVEEAYAAEARIRSLLARPDVRARRSGVDDVILVEGYVSGCEYALEGVLTRGALQVFTIFDKPDPLDGPFFEETIYLSPTALDPGEQRLVHAEVERATRAIGLWHGPVHAEFRLTPHGVFVLEIAARPIGGLCSRVLRFGDGSVSLEEVLLEHASGATWRACAREARAAGVMMIPIPRARSPEAGRRGRARPARAGSRSPSTSRRKRDQLLEPLPEAGSYLGFIFARGESAARPRTSSARRIRASRHRRADTVQDPAADRGRR
jgi:biotin carboxylase